MGSNISSNNKQNDIVLTNDYHSVKILKNEVKDNIIIFDNPSVRNLVRSMLLNERMDHFLFSSGVSENDMQYLSNAMKANRSVNKIVLANCGLENLHLSKISEGIKEDSHLQNLILKSNSFSLEGVVSLNNALMLNNTLKELSLKNCKITDRDVKPLFENMSSFHLSHINLRKNLISDESGEIILVAFSKKMNVTSINLADNKFEEETKKKIINCSENRLKIKF
jgi:hypothetical protein